MSDTTPAPMATPVALPCPLCSRVIKKPHKAKPLNGLIVCPKCRNRFASRRQLAYIVDVVLWEFGAIMPLYYLDVIATAAPAGFTMPGAGMTALEIFLTYAIAATFYFKDGFRGMSPGKALCGVQVVDAETLEPTGFWRSFKRNLCLLVPLAFLIVALTMMKGRRWGDGWAKTRVVWKKYRHNPVFDQRGTVCIKCGYDLTGNTTGRCPECFTPIPPKPQPLPASGQARQTI